MSDEPNPTPAPTSTPQPLGNDPTVRTPDGTIKDPAIATPTPEPAKTSEPVKAGEPAKEPAKAAGAPETYADFKAPEGYEIDKAAIEAAAPIFKELNLNQDQAQKLVDFYATQNKDAAEAPYKAWENLRNEWRDSVIKDPALGDGKAGLRPEVNATIGRAIDSLDPAVAKDFREALVLTGAGDNPAFVKAFYNLAKQLGEGTLVKGGGPSPGGQASPSAPRSAAAALYPNLPTSSAL